MVVRLTWEQESSPDCTWVVVRAEGTQAPVSAAELPGQRVSPGIFSPAWTDPEPVVGAPVRYAVYTQRRTVMSARATIAPDVVFLTRPAELTAKATDRAIELTWTNPPNSDGAELQREEIGPIVAPIYLPVERGQSYLLDKNVKNGARYRYTMRVRFADPTAGRPGAVRYGPASTAEATPSRPPEPPQAPHAQGGPPREGMAFYDHKVVLRWPAPQTSGRKRKRMRGS